MFQRKPKLQFYFVSKNPTNNNIIVVISISISPIQRIGHNRPILLIVFERNDKKNVALVKLMEQSMLESIFFLCNKWIWSKKMAEKNFDPRFDPQLDPQFDTFLNINTNLEVLAQKFRIPRILKLRYLFMHEFWERFFFYRICTFGSKSFLLWSKPSFRSSHFFLLLEPLVKMPLTQYFIKSLAKPHYKYIY